MLLFFLFFSWSCNFPTWMPMQNLTKLLCLMLKNEICVAWQNFKVLGFELVFLKVSPSPWSPWIILLLLDLNTWNPPAAKLLFSFPLEKILQRNLLHLTSSLQSEEQRSAAVQEHAADLISWAAGERTGFPTILTCVLCCCMTPAHFYRLNLATGINWLPV